jgi:tetratricopeptide (TPR) repeat protein
VRRSSTPKCALAALASLLCLSGAPARAELEHADPIVLPTGPLPGPEEMTGPAPERLQRAARLLGERGHHELPYVAWALVESSRRSGDADLAERAVALAPYTPVVLFEAGRLWKRPELAARGLAALLRCFPALLWGVVLGGAVLGAGILLVAGVLQLLAALRGLALAGHALGHAAGARQPPAWPGVLIWLAGLAGLAALGAGPAALLALAGCAAALRLRPAESVTAATALVAAGLVLGPGLDLWARAAASLEREGALGSAWRVERGHPLPGDEDLLERALARHPDDALVRFALVTARARAGERELALTLLADARPSDRPELRAAGLSLYGSLEFAAGNVGRAVEAFEQARAVQEDVAVLFNLSQAYGRALRLTEQAPTYSAARALDPRAVARFGDEAGADPHQLLMPVQLPAGLYLSRALAPSPAAARLARELRARLLGRALPDAAWMALPLLGLIGAGLRRSSIARCKRCERTLCAHCAPENQDAAVCLRCVRLFEQRQNVDPRVRKEQLQLDRRHQRRLALRAAGFALLAPGAESLRRGRCASGSAQLLLAALGAALVASPHFIAAPWDVGPLGHWLALAGGLGLLVPVYLGSFAQALRLARGREVRR